MATQQTTTDQFETHVTTLAIDAMGGDKAPFTTIEGVALAHKKHPDVHFKVFGLDSSVVPELKKQGLWGHNKIQFVACSEIISGATEPRLAIRQFKDSSMRRAIQAVADGEADAVVSAGNTGAYMVLSKLLLKTIPGLQRPAITTLLPTKDGKGIVMLDLGANVHVPADVLVQFCIMGQAFAKCVQGIRNPSVALLNIGSEELKGTTVLKEAQSMIQKAGAVENYTGFIEGDDVFNGKVDVIVTDGFTGNVALKTIEGTVKFVAEAMREELKRTWITRLGAFISLSGFKAFKKRLDPRRYNGAQFLGLRGISVKSHGGTDAFGFSCAISVAFDLAKNKVNESLESEIETLQEKLIIAESGAGLD